MKKYLIAVILAGCAMLILEGVIIPVKIQLIVQPHNSPVFSFFLFCPKNSPKPKDTLSVITDKGNQQILTFKNQEHANVLTFLLEKFLKRLQLIAAALVLYPFSSALSPLQRFTAQIIESL